MCARIESLARKGIEVLNREVARKVWSWRLLSDSKDGQTVLEYASGAEHVVGKFYQDDSGRQNFRALEQLISSHCDTLRVPRPVFYDADGRLLLVRKARGRTCQAMRLTEADGCLNRIGRSLRELHGCRIDLGEIKGMGDHLADLVSPAPEALAAAFPQYTAVIQSMLNVLRTHGQGWHETSAAPLHRDFHLRQLFDDGAHITVIDWDLSAHGDPAFDVAYLTTYLKTHYSGEEAARGIDTFLAGYCPDVELLRRIPYYEQFNYLRRACRRFRLKDAGWQQSLHAMLEQVTLAAVCDPGG